MFKPKVSMESQELLVQQYKHLRQRDTGGSAKSSWRITVRQLESMLRLSESFARLHCSEEVTAKHVKEAYRLLNKSIIRYERFCYLRIIYNLNNNRVDQPDVDLDNDDAPEEDPVEETMETDAEPEPTETTKKPMKLTYEKYKKMSFLLIDYIKNKEETLEATEGGDTDNTLRTDSEFKEFLMYQYLPVLESCLKLLKYICKLYLVWFIKLCRQHLQ